MKIEINNRQGAVLFSGDFPSVAEAVFEAVSQGVNLSGANLHNANFFGADLRGVDFSGANLSGTSFSVANLSGANFSGANLIAARFSEANCSDADFSDANFSGADLSAARLSTAKLSGANFSNARLCCTELYAFAQVAFSGHGECGRMLTAFQQTKSSKVMFQCGCFSGSVKDLKKYIKEGSPCLRKTRTLAMRTVLKLLEVKRGK